ncbi:MAG: 3-phosphoserine/phosphohydroxythreonine transaminase [candidate division Zixibacteria bacterium]|nr:3-phosphoserine/phosphohydroxythreonine transaminase [candidate division Zixibacteria bacterium]
MANRVFNFNPGPSTLPLEVLKIIQDELLDYRDTGMSIIESSHRSPEFDEVNEAAISLAREVFGLDDKYHVVFLTGGASQQFFQIPMNFLAGGKTGAYADTGTWSTKAIKEANIVSRAYVAFDGKAVDYKHIPSQNELDIPADSAYLHITTNNTIKGTQYHYLPETNGLPLIADMSSDIASRRLDYSKFAMFYAGSQKNLGASGTTLVVMRDDLLQKSNDELPTLLNYKTQAAKKSLSNTPPSFSIYVVKLILEWIKRQGGLHGVEKINERKKDLIYGVIDNNTDYFKGAVEKDSRSWMNITLRLPSEDLEKKFIADAKAAGFIGLKGHRSVGGVRASVYNAMPLEGAEKLAQFMEDFKKKN